MEHMYIISSPMIGILPISNHHIVLPHLYDTTPGYLDAYKKLSDSGDFIMQDNSIFELKQVVAGDLIDFGKRVGASEIVVPEVLRDFKTSRDRQQDFFGSRAYNCNSGSFWYAAVIQGKSYSELVKHYNWLASIDEVDTIGISFNYEFDAFGDRNEEKRHSGWNRFSIIRRMMKDRVWDSTKTHHLLGMYNPAELSAYYRICDERYEPSDFLNSIRSNDSSSCFWHSLYGVKFELQSGFLYKKIETHVDFNSCYTDQSQINFFNFNSVCIEKWRKGKGGSDLWQRYLAFAQKEGFIL